MSERRTRRDIRRRAHGQNFLTDYDVVDRLIQNARITPEELVLDLGAGRGALTIAAARAGARVLAVELDPVWTKQLRRRATALEVDHLVEVVEQDLRRVPLPTGSYRVIANPPFRLTTSILARLFDEPDSGPWRADLVLQREVAHKRAISPPTTLRSAAWAPWWTFELGEIVPRTAFRPMPGTNAAILVARRRQSPVLPAWLAPEMRKLLRPGWDPPLRR